MGLMDRDYMREKPRQRPFSPPPERFSTLGKTLIFVVVLLLLYKVADWKLNQRANDRANNRPAANAEQIEHPAAISVPTLPQSPTSPGAPEGTRSTYTVTKCVVNGKTSYGDESCARGAVTSHVTTRTDHNLMAAVRPQSAGRTETTFTQETVVTQSSPVGDARKTECALIDAQIKNLDAMARQPQSGQTQDWITAERKKLRDRQFRIPCQ